MHSEDKESDCSDFEFQFKLDASDLGRIERTAIGTLKGLQNRESLQNFLRVKGISTTKVLPMGANEVALEFIDRPVMLEFLRRG